jgi:osmotically-inducible protein OsmY
MNIAVTTMGGRVTLAGIVNGESQKREILATARRIAGDSNVEDRLETKRKGKTSEL